MPTLQHLGQRADTPAAAERHRRWRAAQPRRSTTGASAARLPRPAADGAGRRAAPAAAAAALKPPLWPAPSAATAAAAAVEASAAVVANAARAAADRADQGQASAALQNPDRYPADQRPCIPAVGTAADSVAAAAANAGAAGAAQGARRVRQAPGGWPWTRRCRRRGASQFAAAQLFLHSAATRRPPRRSDSCPQRPAHQTPRVQAEAQGLGLLGCLTACPAAHWAKLRAAAAAQVLAPQSPPQARLHHLAAHLRYAGAAQVPATRRPAGWALEARRRCGRPLTAVRAVAAQAAATLQSAGRTPGPSRAAACCPPAASASKAQAHHCTACKPGHWRQMQAAVGRHMVPSRRTDR